MLAPDQDQTSARQIPQLKGKSKAKGNARGRGRGEEREMGFMFRVRLSSFFAGAAAASVGGFYYLYKDYMVAQQVISQQVRFYPFLLLR